MKLLRGRRQISGEHRYEPLVEDRGDSFRAIWTAVHWL